MVVVGNKVKKRERRRKRNVEVAWERGDDWGVVIAGDEIKKEKGSGVKRLSSTMRSRREQQRLWLRIFFNLNNLKGIPTIYMIVE